MHPGAIVRQECLEPLQPAVTAAAVALGVTRQALNNVIGVARLPDPPGRTRAREEEGLDARDGPLQT